MLKKYYLLASLSLLLCDQVFAASTPKGSTFDLRIQKQRFNAQDVTRIFGSIGITTMISFLQDEQILNVASGFADGWDFTVEHNAIFLKPISVGENIEPNHDWNTNLIVKTSKRVYVFDLIFTEKTAKATYVLNFSDEVEEKKLAKKEKEKSLVEQRLNKPNVISRNWDYTMKIGKDSQVISPDFAYDDGNFTYIGFTKNKEFPSVFQYEGKGKESIVNTHTKQQKNYHILVIQKVAPALVLRSGGKVVGVFNESFSKRSLKGEIHTTATNNVGRWLKNVRQ